MLIFSPRPAAEYNLFSFMHGHNISIPFIIK